MLFKTTKTRNPSLFISLGAGENQVPLIEEARRQGFKVIGVDRNSRAPGFALCDLKIQESIDNYREIIYKLREIIIYGDIKGVLTKSFGSAVKSACYISEQFGIPMIPPHRLDDFINKRKMKKVFQKNGINSPGYEIIAHAPVRGKKSPVRFPAVAKPPIGHAKRGVRLVKSVKELEKIMGSENSSSYLLEEYIRGNEIIAVGLVFKGTFNLVSVSDKITSPPPFFVDLMHVYPSRYAHLEGQISRIGQSVTECFEMYTSPLIMELTVTDKEEIYLIEAVPEFGGECIPEVLIPHGTGYNFIGETIRAVSGGRFTPPIRSRSHSSVVIKYLTGTRGTLVSLNDDSPGRIPEIIFTRMLKDAGSKTRNPVNNHDRIGVLAAKSHTIMDATAAIDRAVESMGIVIR